MKNSTDDVLKKPIIIVGAPRSGTTILSLILKQHPHLAFLDEPRLIWRYGNDRKSDMLTRDNATPAVCAHIRSEFAAAVRAADRPRLLEKTPANSLRLEFVDRVFPDCKIIHITRGGVESVLSIRRFWTQHATGVRPAKLRQRLREVGLRRAPFYAAELLRRTLSSRVPGMVKKPVWGPRIPGIDALLRDLDLLDVCSLQWRTCVESACQFGRRMPPDRYRECRLEDMSPELIRSLLEFAELDDAPEIWSWYQREFDPSQSDRRSQAADPADVAQIRSWIEPTLKWLGYE